MIRKIAILVFFCGIAFSQTLPALPPPSSSAPGSTDAPTVANPPATVGTYPDQFYTAGALYSGGQVPPVSGFAGMGKHLGGGTYSFTGYSAIPAGGKLVTSMTTGVAQHTRDILGVGLFLIVGAGVSQSATGTATQTGLALNGAMLAVYPIGKAGLRIDFIGQVNRTPSGDKITFGVGFGFAPRR